MVLLIKGLNKYFSLTIKSLWIMVILRAPISLCWLMEMCFLTMRSSIIFYCLPHLSQFLGVILWFSLLEWLNLEHSTFDVSNENTFELGKDWIVECLYMQFWADYFVWMNRSNSVSLLSIFVRIYYILFVMTHIWTEMLNSIHPQPFYNPSRQSLKAKSIQNVLHAQPTLIF